MNKQLESMNEQLVAARLAASGQDPYAGVGSPAKHRAEFQPSAAASSGHAAQPVDGDANSTFNPLSRPGSQNLSAYAARSSKSVLGR